MKKHDWFTAKLKQFGFNAEISAMGYWVELDWDYEGHSRWELFSSHESAWDYLRRNGMVSLG